MKLVSTSYGLGTEGHGTYYPGRTVLGHQEPPGGGADDNFTPQTALHSRLSEIPKFDARVSRSVIQISPLTVTLFIVTPRLQ